MGRQRCDAAKRVTGSKPVSSHCGLRGRKPDGEVVGEKIGVDRPRSARLGEPSVEFEIGAPSAGAPDASRRQYAGRRREESLKLDSVLSLLPPLDLLRRPASLRLDCRRKPGWLKLRLSRQACPGGARERLRCLATALADAVMDRLGAREPSAKSCPRRRSPVGIANASKKPKQWPQLMLHHQRVAFPAPGGGEDDGLPRSEEGSSRSKTCLKRPV